MSRRVTIDDVAEMAGVSYQTVSRVINDKPEVSPTTRARVQQVISTLGYRPSRVARSLATARTATIGLVVPDIANPYFSDIAHGVEQSGYEQGYSLLLCNTNEEPQREVDVLHVLDDKQVDGVIVCGLRQTGGPLRAALARLPAAVLVNRQLEGLALPAVMVDDVTGGYLATSHLLTSGHRAVGFVAGPIASDSGKRRAQGYARALAEHNIRGAPDWLRHCAPVVADGERTAAALLEAHAELTALFCYNDLVAAGALQACKRIGRKVPDDIAIVGFDDIHLAALMTPSLTTCHVPRVDIGRLAFDLLLRQIDTDEAGDAVIQISPRLIIRASAPG
jgi:LacI family transcriptional regulator